MRTPIHADEPRPKRTPVYAGTPVNGNRTRPHLDPSINETINPDGVPEALRSQARWILWRWVKRRQGDGTTKMTKVPMSAITGQIGVDAHDPTNWTTFEAAVAAAWTPGTLADGLGFDLVKDDPIVGVDLDHCIGVYRRYAIVNDADLQAATAKLETAGHGPVSVPFRGGRAKTRSLTR
jgi:hypothetical protein